MSNNVLILDAGRQNFGKGGELNHYLSRIAEEELTKLGWNVEIKINRQSVGNCCRGRKD